MTVHEVRREEGCELPPWLLLRLRDLVFECSDDEAVDAVDFWRRVAWRDERGVVRGWWWAA